MSHDPFIRSDLDPVRSLCCPARKAKAREQACFWDPLRVRCETCGAQPPNGCKQTLDNRVEVVDGPNGWFVRVEDPPRETLTVSVPSEKIGNLVADFVRGVLASSDRFFCPPDQALQNALLFALQNAHFTKDQVIARLAEEIDGLRAQIRRKAELAPLPPIRVDIPEMAISFARQMIANELEQMTKGTEALFNPQTLGLIAAIEHLRKSTREPLPWTQKMGLAVLARILGDGSAIQECNAHHPYTFASWCLAELSYIPRELLPYLPSLIEKGRT